jgi:hypothetical protein
MTRPTCLALALFAALPVAARADAWPPLAGPLAPADQGYSMRRNGDYPGGYDGANDGRRYQPQAREGPLFSLGLGGGSLYLSNDGPSRIGAADLDLRLGYGFSNRFQLFMDFEADGGTNQGGASVGSWTWTVRGQTLLVGDRRGNGLNVNFGAGFGGLTYNTGAPGRSAETTGLALGGGLSYDARITPWLSFSPELFFTWHDVPNAPGIPDDVASVYGLRLSLLWYLH